MIDAHLSVMCQIPETDGTIDKETVWYPVRAQVTCTRAENGRLRGLVLKIAYYNKKVS